MATLDEFLPGLRDRVLDHRLFTPLDLETELALTHGDEYHGQMGLDQLLFMRPVAGWAGTARRWRGCTCAARAPIRGVA